MHSTNSFSFTVLGKPAPQGSKTYLGHGMKEASDRLPSWRSDIRAKAEGLLPSKWHAILPMQIDVEFLFPRPQSDFRSNGQLKPSALKHCTKRVGDLDKLTRALCDALTGLCYHDDSQIIRINAIRRYATEHEQPSAIITITAIN